MRKVLLLAACVLMAACDFRLDLTDTPAASPTSPGAVTVTNTNTNTTTIDRSDTGTAPSSGGASSPTTGALPLPAYGEGVVRDFAAAHPALVAHSCQITDGESAWQFLDQLIAVLQNRDARWGYLCKDASCSTVGRDVITYKASSGDTGIFIVDVLGNHCPGPTDSPTQVRYGVLPFETVRRWIGTRP